MAGALGLGGVQPPQMSVLPFRAQDLYNLDISLLGWGTSARINLYTLRDEENNFIDVCYFHTPCWRLN